MTMWTKWAAVLGLGTVVWVAGCYRPANDGGLYNPPVEKFKAGQAIDRGDFGEAQTRLLYVLDNDPSDWEAHYLLGKAYLGQGRPLEAQSELEQALAAQDRSETNTPKLLDAIAEAMLKQENYAELYAFLDAQISRYEGWEDYTRKARFLVKAGDIDNAAVAYQQAAFFSRNETADIYVELADFYEGIGDHDKALQALKWAYYIDDERPDLPGRFRSLGVVPGPTLKEAPPQPEYPGAGLFQIPDL